jgi:hypothetical protein
MESRIVDLAFAFDYWVFGGYVRDVMICGKIEFNDIDICVPRSRKHTVDSFLNTLGIFYPVEVTADHKVHYGLMSPGIDSLVRVLINGNVKLDLVLFDGELDDWKKECTVNMSCNLFYTSRETPLGIRYIPKMYRYEAAPARTILQMTKNNIFEVIFEPGEASERECKKLQNVVMRVGQLVERGWHMKGDAMNKAMVKCAQEQGPLWDTFLSDLADTVYDKQKDRQAEAVNLPEHLTENIRRRLDFF